MNKTKPPGNRPARPRPKPLPTLTVTIDRLDAEGIGIARHAGKEVLVFGAFPGETLEVAVEHEGQRRIVARPLKFANRSKERRPSPCPAVSHCRGCPLLQLKDQAHLDFKQSKIELALTAHPVLRGLQVPAVWSAPHTLGYRTSAKLVLGRVRRQTVIGLYRRGSHDIVDIGDCPLHHPLINRIVAVVREEIDKLQIPVYDPKRGQGLLRYLLVRVAPQANKAMVTLVTRERDYRQLTHLAKWLQRKVPEVISVHQNVNATSGNVITGRETFKVLGVPDLIDQVGDVRLRLGPTSFLQVNHDQAARIYRLVREWAAMRSDETVVDLYCGIGGIALHLAADAGRVLGIEVVEEAVQNARDNARMNERQNCSFQAGDAGELLEDLTHTLPPGCVVVVNPPRTGCEPAVLENIVALRPRTLIYVSCNPETLARDLALLHGQGYRVQRLQPVDMFPQTPHVETVVQLVPHSGGHR